MAGIVRKGSISKSSKTDIRKQARKPDKGIPSGRRLSRSIRAQLYRIEVIIAGDAPSQVHRCWYYILYQS